MDNSLSALESLCERLFNSQDPAERSHAEQRLSPFSSSPDFIPQCQLILDNSQSPYAQLLASSSLVRQVTEQNLTPQLRADIRSYVLSYLAKHGPSRQPFVSSSLIQLFCRLTKLGWTENERCKEVVKESAEFLAQGTMEHFYLGLKILNQLVSEMNQANPGRPLTHHRKTACSFRDLCIFQIFQLSLTSLRQLRDAADDKLREQALSLSLRCLSFDFVGTAMDESTEDLSTIQVPSSWRPTLEDPSTIGTFFEYYAVCAPPLSNQALECLVRLASVRRSLFSGEGERMAFLSQLMAGTREILNTQKGLSEHENYHEFCRLLGRLKTNYQLSELVNVEKYDEWIRLVADFTVKSLQSWQWTSGSVYYLLGLWSRMVSSTPYLKSDSPSLLDAYVPDITRSYISSRLDSVQAVLQSQGLDDPLDNEEQLQDQMDSLPYICRFQYESTSEFLLTLIEPTLRAYSEASQSLPSTSASSSSNSSASSSLLPTLSSNGPSSTASHTPSSSSLSASSPPPPSSSPSLPLLEGQLTWIVHIVGAIIRGRLSSNSGEYQEGIDAVLSAQIFRIIQVTDAGSHAQRYSKKSKQKLDSALLSFLQNFRRVYVGDQAMHSSKALYARLSELIGLHDHLRVLNLTVAKIACNLKCYAKCEDLIEQTLNLFQELAGGYMSGKLLLKLESVNFILSHHTSEHFPFLSEYVNTRNRTVFLFTLSRLLFMEDNAIKFKAFIAPLQNVLVSLENASSNPSPFRSSSVIKFALIGVFRDLRGITMATNSRRTFSLLFDWLYPAHFPLFLRAADVWADTPEVSTPLLKFIAEFVINKTQRLTFDPSSPNGILLFREVSKIITTFGCRVLALHPPSANPPPALSNSPGPSSTASPPPHNSLSHSPSSAASSPASAGDVYGRKYKGIWICLTILTRALAGSYVNFGVFELYGDRALAEALDMALHLSLSIPLRDILAFRKVSRAYFALIEVTSHSHIHFLLNLPSSSFHFILLALDAGLKSLDVNISSQCASAVDNLAAFYFTHVTMADPPLSLSPAVSSSPPSLSSSLSLSSAKDLAAAINLQKHLTEFPLLFPEILKTLFEIVLFEECANQWSLSRPMLSLILINEQIYSDLKMQFLNGQPTEMRSRLSECFDKLMSDVERSLEPKNRDRFTQNLTTFRHDFRAR